MKKLILLLLLSHSCFAIEEVHVEGEYKITTPDGSYIQIEQLKQQAAAAEAQRAIQAAQQAQRERQQYCNRQRGYNASERAACDSRASFAQKTAAQACPTDVIITIEVGNNAGGISTSYNPRTKCVDDAKFEYTDAIKICVADEKINNSLLPSYCY